MNVRTYYKYRDEGRCVICGVKLPFNHKFVKCDICRNSGRRDWYKRKIDRETLPEDAKALRDMRRRTIDDMAKEARTRGISYGKLQCEETSAFIRENERLRRMA